MRPSADRIADPAPEPRDPLSLPLPKLVERPAPDESCEDDDDDDFAGPFAAW